MSDYTCSTVVADGLEAVQDVQSAIQYFQQNYPTINRSVASIKAFANLLVERLSSRSSAFCIVERLLRSGSLGVVLDSDVLEERTNWDTEMTQEYVVRGQEGLRLVTAQTVDFDGQIYRAEDLASLVSICDKWIFLDNKKVLLGPLLFK